MIAPDYVIWGLFKDNTLVSVSINLEELKSWFDRRLPNSFIEKHYSIKQLNVFVAEPKE